MPCQVADDHPAVLQLIAGQCPNLRSLIWDWPIASRNLPTAVTLAELANAAPTLRQLAIPANLTFAHRCPTTAHKGLEHLMLTSDTVYIEEERAHEWLERLYPNADISDQS
ncbi:hypothetical protein DACRYDRAFT_25481 [Dacryopinax primogenitus]|uniref:F-box domain-containing protein n=1 Tax=Dacryopinax primogenitus (strain DJM 731) TaxID=1858805 RepID=M5FP38_DACPD|nr:uncharacterized protein DACRYDRAFT_25481 [Dacryopinax primogenitus]EJT96788.1 hypothetical protein DACRYDRAFT_25481 [Dacryopinax primogenitus]